MSNQTHTMPASLRLQRTSRVLENPELPDNTWKTVLAKIEALRCCTHELDQLSDRTNDWRFEGLHAPLEESREVVREWVLGSAQSVTEWLVESDEAQPLVAALGGNLDWLLNSRAGADPEFLLTLIESAIVQRYIELRQRRRVLPESEVRDPVLASTAK